MIQNHRIDGIRFREETAFIIKKVLKNYNKTLLNFQIPAALSGVLCLNKPAITKLRTFFVVSYQNK